MDWWLLGKALCLVLVIEGILMFLTPRHLRDAAAALMRTDDRTLRALGLVSMASGAGLLYLLKP